MSLIIVMNVQIKKINLTRAGRRDAAQRIWYSTLHMTDEKERERETEEKSLSREKSWEERRACDRVLFKDLKATIRRARKYVRRKSSGGPLRKSGITRMRGRVRPSSLSTMPEVADFSRLLFVAFAVVGYLRSTSFFIAQTFK